MYAALIFVDIYVFLTSKRRTSVCWLPPLSTMFPLWLHGVFFCFRKNDNAKNERKLKSFSVKLRKEGGRGRKRTIWLLLQWKQKSELSCRSFLLMFFSYQHLNSMAFLCWAVLTSRFCLANWENAVLRNDHLTSSTVCTESKTRGRSLQNVTASRVRS